MLGPHELSVGPLATATGLTLVLARSSDQESFLVSGATDTPIAIFLEGEHRFGYIPSASTDYSGVLVPAVTIEIDETSVLDERAGKPAGALVRKHAQLYIMAQHQPRARPQSVAIISNLPACFENETAVFGRWQIVLGEGLSKRVLMKIDITVKDTGPS